METAGNISWVAARGPWHWERQLARPRSQASLDMLVAETAGGSRFESGVLVEGQDVPVSVAGSAGGMAVRTAALTAAAHDAAVEAAAARFSAGRGGDRAAAFFSRAAADPVLQSLAARWWGIRPLRDASPWVALARLILGQQVSAASHRTLVNRLLAEWGTPLTTPTGAIVYAWPQPERLASAAPQALAAGGIPRRPAATLQAAARWAAAGGLDGSRDPEEVKRQLGALPGVGPWTTAGVALFGWGEDDAAMASDLVLAKAAAALTGSGERLSARALEQWLAPHRPHRSWVCYLLWHLRLPPVD